MTEEEHTINDLRIGNAKLEQRVNFLEKVVYGIASVLLLNMVGLFCMWVSTFFKQ